MPICLMTAITITKAIGIDRKGNPYGFPVLIGGKDMFRKWLALVIGLLLTCSVTGYAASQQPYLLKSVLSIGVGETYVLGDVPDGTWSVSDSSIADVAEGRVIGKKNGTVTVTAQNAEGKAASCKVTVKQAPSEVKLSKSVLTLGVGESFRLSAIVPEGTAAAVRKFYTSNSHVLQMTKTDWTAEFTAVRRGVAWVTVKLYNGLEASCRVTVKQAPSEVELSRHVITMNKGETVRLSAIVPDGTGAALRTFRSSNSAILKMTKTDWTGEFTAVNTGTAWVTVRLYNGVEQSCRVIVKVGKKVYLSPSNQNGNLYAYGNTNEMAQCNRIAEAAKAALERCGFDVKKAPAGQNMYTSIEQSNRWDADLHMPIHTNAHGMGYLSNGTMCMVYRKSAVAMSMAEPIYRAVQSITPGSYDYGIIARPELAELNKTDAVAVYVEVDFHDVPSIAKWLIDHPVEIGEAIAKGVCSAYGVRYTSPV